MLCRPGPYLGVGRIGDGVCRGGVCSIAGIIQNIGQTGALPGSHGGESLAVIQGGGGLGLAACRGVGPGASFTHAPQLHLKGGGAERGEGVIETLLVGLRGRDVDSVGEGGRAADLLHGVKWLKKKRVAEYFQLVVAPTVTPVEERLGQGREILCDVLLRVPYILLVLLIPGGLVVQ